MKIDFDNIILKAYETLIIQDNLTFPIDVFNLKTKENVKIISYSKIASINDMTYDDFKKKSQDSPAFRYKENNYYFIIYDDKISSKGRMRWSIAHEYGHIVLNHENQSDQNEIEANFFAANLLVPKCILKELKTYKRNFTKEYLVNKFGISNEAASRYFNSINNNAINLKNEYDDIIIKKSEKFIKSEIKNTDLFKQLEDEEMQEKRDQWLY